MFNNTKLLILANKDFCIEETLAFIQEKIATNHPAFVDLRYMINGLPFCRRDLEYVIDAYAEDCANENTDQMYFISSRYWKGSVSALIGTRQKEVITHKFLRDLLTNFVIKNILYSSKQQIQNQVVLNYIAEDGSDTLIKECCDILTGTILTGPTKKFLHNYLSDRFTAKWWNNKPVAEPKIEAILECAYQSPSKQGHHDFEIHVLTDSPAGRAFKEWLYYENTACLDSIPGKPGPGLRRYNGQVLAPVVMIWLAKRFDKNKPGESEWLRTNNDCIISSTMAMCQAEELGIRTGFCGALGGGDIARRLNRPDHFAVISVGFGYATPENVFNKKVYKEGVEIGFDLANVNPANRRAPNRSRRPNKYSMVKYL